MADRKADSFEPTPVRSLLCGRMVCARCGMIGVDVRPEPSELCDGDASCVFERAGFEPRYRRLRYVVAPRYLGLCLAFLKALNGLLALMRGQGWRPAKPHSAGLSAGPALAGTGKDQLALEIRKSTQDGQHQAPMRSRGVRPCVGQRFEAGAGLGNRVENIEQVARGPSEPIQPCHHQHVTVAEAPEQLGQLGAVRLRA
jgi:hypothetical protein